MPPPRSPARGPQGRSLVTFIVDPRHAQAMTARAIRAVGGPSLGAFLAGTVDVWLRERAQSRFAAEGDDVVGQWAPLKEATAAIRESEGYPGEHPINVRTGELEDYIAQGQASLAVSPNQAVLTRPGSSPSGQLREKFKTAQIGSNEPRTVPRPVLGMNVTDLEFMMTSLERHLVSQMGVGTAGTGGTWV